MAALDQIDVRILTAVQQNNRLTSDELGNIARPCRSSTSSIRLLTFSENAIACPGGLAMAVLLRWPVCRSRFG